MGDNQSKNIVVLSEVGRQGYEASVLMRMQGRSGAYSPKGANGIVLEIMANDCSNLKNVLKQDTYTKLTKSPIAKQVDAVTMQGGKVIERIQYKDTTSPAGIQKTLRQVESGKYRQAQLKGTTETAEKFNQLAEAKGISKRMDSTGISSKTTKRIGDKFTGQMPKLSNVGDVAKSSAKMATCVTVGAEVVKSIVNGDSAGECVNHVVSKSAESAITAAASTAAAEVAFGAASTLLAESAVPIAGPLIVASTVAIGTGMAIGELTDGLFDDIGEGIGNIVEEIGDVISDICFDAKCTFVDLFV